MIERVKKLHRIVVFFSDGVEVTTKQNAHFLNYLCLTRNIISN